MRHSFAPAPGIAGLWAARATLGAAGLLLSHTVLAAGSGVLTGDISSDHSPLPDAVIHVIDHRHRTVATTRSNADGHYTVRGLAPGHYEVQVSESGFGTKRVPVAVHTGATAQLGVALSAELASVTVTAQRFEAARNALSPTTGGSQYKFSQKTISTLPQGENTPLNEVLLQAPGVVQDSYGQLHVRGDHGDLQYRINGVILPEGISTFGQTLDTRFASNIKLLTGALPAQFGEQTAGVIDITTKKDMNGGDFSLYGGSQATINPSLQYGATDPDGTTAYFSGSYFGSQVGVQAPTAAYTPIHDRTQQGKAFGFFSMYPASNLRLSVMAGTAVNRFEIPNTPGLSPDPAFTSAAGVSGFDSALLNERQFEHNTFGVIALQGLLPNDGSWQFAGFRRDSSVMYEPDPLGDLLFNGVAATVKRKSRVTGVQGDVSLPLSSAHTLRLGLYATTEDDRSDNTAQVFPVDSSGNPTGGPITIVDNNPTNGNTLAAAYLQDQWNISSHFTLNYGVRFDHLSAYTTSSALSPRIGAVWYVTPSTTVHGGYARYFTPPPNELVANSSLTKFAGTSNAPEVTQNSPVQPERSDYFDLGATQQVTPWLNVGLDGYYKFVRNLLDEGQFGQALIYTPFNYRIGHVYGLELSSSLHRGPWTAYLNLARSVAQATGVASGQFNFDPAELAYIADHYVYLDHDQGLTGSGGLSYERWQTTYSLDGIYGSGLRNGFANTTKLPPYLQLNASVGHHFHRGWFGPINVRVTLINLLDRTYLLRDGSGIGVGAPQYGPRRGAFLTLSKPL
jgi:hypothetical protein